VIKRYLIIAAIVLLMPVLAGFGEAPAPESSEKVSEIQKAERAPVKNTIEQKGSAAANDLLKKIDENRLVGGKIATSKMIVRGRRNERTIVAKSWQRGLSDSFSEYLAPAREKGVKMLKLKDQLWTYSPQTDRTILISGHMLRQSVMGSDLSYEEMMEDPSLVNSYTAEILGKEKILERSTVLLELTARKEADVAYVKRKIWVDEERFVVLKEELYAKSGTLLKTYNVQSVGQVDDKWYPIESLYKDALKTGKGTTFIIEELEYNDNIPDRIFSKGSLRK
jgi:outer membrane lipoprotein-sorting protein